MLSVHWSKSIPLTDPTKSRNGWAWCRNPRCRRPHQIWDVNGSRVAMTMDGETLQRQYPGKVPSEVTRRWPRR